MIITRSFRLTTRLVGQRNGRDGEEWALCAALAHHFEHKAHCSLVGLQGDGGHSVDCPLPSVSQHGKVHHSAGSGRGTVHPLTDHHRELVVPLDIILELQARSIAGHCKLNSLETGNSERGETIYNIEQKFRNFILAKHRNEPLISNE